MDKLGKMIRITDLRSVWPHEANDFTRWLAQEENLTLLGDAIDIELELEERESSVGSFNVDIFAKEVVLDGAASFFAKHIKTIGHIWTNTVVL